MMNDKFKLGRLVLFGIIFVGAVVVLGITINLTVSLSNTGLHDFLLFGIVVSVLTVLVFIHLTYKSHARVDAAIVFVLAVLWLTMGAYSMDVIGQQSCFALKGQTIPAKNGTISAEGYCRQIKTIQAFSWANFVFLTLGFIWLLRYLSEQGEGGEKDSMSDAALPTRNNPSSRPYDYPISNSGSIRSGRSGRSGRGAQPPPQAYYPPPGSNYSSHGGDYPVSNYPTSNYPASNYPTSNYPTSNYPASNYPASNYPGPGSNGAPPRQQIIQQKPGHSVILQNGRVTQVPGSVVSA
ncbi:hypothetical protein BDV93DRAFT_273699 [Ceratobasidium sp. AG-I]|nr:hypothetical protein BDV93DRAFT_273699 [Ceratobasidium sp. AG-I]